MYNLIKQNMFNKKILKQLHYFGFTSSQAKIYLAGLRLGKILMAPLAKAAQVKRSGVYYIMEELKRRKFFSSKKIGKRTYYIAASPEKLFKMTLEREILIRKILPLLKAIIPKK